MEKIDITVCLKEYQKNCREAKKSKYNNKYNSFLILI